MKTRRRQATLSIDNSQVRYKLANTVWKRLYKAKRSRYTGAAVMAQSRTSLTAVTAAALLCAAAANALGQALLLPS